MVILVLIFYLMNNIICLHVPLLMSLSAWPGLSGSIRLHRQELRLTSGPIGVGGFEPCPDLAQKKWHQMVDWHVGSVALDLMFAVLLPHHGHIAAEIIKAAATALISSSLILYYTLNTILQTARFLWRCSALVKLVPNLVSTMLPYSE